VADDEPESIPVGTEPEPEEGATGRRWRVSLPLILFGVALVVVGLIDHWWPPIAAGVVVVIYFGGTAAGAKEHSVGSDTIRAKSKFKTPPPPPERRIFLPRGRRPKRKR
jgi:hypothetical protein